MNQDIEYFKNKMYAFIEENDTLTGLNIKLKTYVKHREGCSIDIDCDKCFNDEPFMECNKKCNCNCGLMELLSE